jgi:CHAT domain-containing protein
MELENDTEAIREAHEQLDEVIRDIRAVPGFETFLARPTFADLVAAAAGHPVVYLSAADLGGLALVLDGAEVRHVALDGLTTEALQRRVADYAASLSRWRSDSTAYRAQWDAALDAMLRWLWNDAMAPVVDALRPHPQAALVAGGLLGLLPLHAAWTEDDSRPSGRRYVLDEVALSYVPNARALAAARELTARAATDRALIVVEPRPVSAAALDWAPVEGAVAEGCSPNAIVLAGGEATHAAVRKEIGRAELIHLACHGIADLDAPLDSGLLLAGNSWLTLGELLDMRLEARLAVLSACET